MAISVQDRMAIVREHMDRHGGVYDPALFVVEAADPDHPAHDYFEWDDTAAAAKWRLVQARRFISIRLDKVAPVVTDLTDGQTQIVVQRGPAFVSPMRNRDRGGYRDARTPFGQKELRAQAADGSFSFSAVLRRYRAVMDEDQILMAEQLILSFKEELDEMVDEALIE